MTQIEVLREIVVLEFVTARRKCKIAMSIFRKTAVLSLLKIRFHDFRNFDAIYRLIKQ